MALGNNMDMDPYIAPSIAQVPDISLGNIEV